MDWTTGFFLAMCVVGILAVLWYMYARKHPKQPTTVKKKTRPNNIGYPAGAWEQGYHDMLWAVYQVMFKEPRDTDFRFRTSHVWGNPIQKMAELMVENNIVSRYKKLDIKDGRTSRRYMASQDSEEFAQYVLGSRTVIDQLDDALLRIQDEKELAEARQKGLETFDEQYTNARKALGIVRDKDYRVLTEHEEFDKQMRGIENIKKNKT